MLEKIKNHAGSGVNPRLLESIRVLFLGGGWFSFLEALCIYFLNFDFKNEAFGSFLP
jgi:hypothetical protein